MHGVLVTGADGFVGTALVRRLAGEGLFVKGAVRRERSLPSSMEWLAIGNICSVNDWAPSLEAVDTIVHLAARAHILKETDPDPRRAFFEVNVAATERLAYAAAKAGVRRFVFLSSIGVHGAMSDIPLDETSPIRPWNAYTESKWSAEQALARISRETGLSVAVIRTPLIYGEGVKGNFRKLMEYVDRGIPLPLANVNNRRSLAALENVVDLIVCCCRDERADGEVFLVADDETVSTTELIRRIAGLLKKRARLFPVPAAWARSLAAYLERPEVFARLYGSLYVDIGKARRVLGWQPVVSAKDSLARTASWYMAHGK